MAIIILLHVVVFFFFFFIFHALVIVCDQVLKGFVNFFKDTCLLPVSGLFIMKGLQVLSPPWKFHGLLDFKAIDPNLLYYARNVPKSECKELFDQALGELDNSWLGTVSNERALERKA